MTSASPSPTLPLSGARIAVTGANGFVGAHLIRRLLREGADVIGIVRPAATVWRLEHILPRLTLVRSELSTLANPELEATLGGTSIIFHLAAAGTNQSEHDAERVLTGNVEGTFRVVQCAERVGVRRVVLAGTGHEYGLGANLSEDALPRPRTVYAASKVAAGIFAHTYAKQRGLDVVTLRTFSLYGGGQARHFLVPAATLAAIADEPIPLTSGTQLRDYVYVGDAVDAYLRAAVTPGVSGEIFNVASGREIRVVDFVTTLIATAGSRSELRLGEVRETATELWHSSGATDHAWRLLGWRARTAVEEGLRETVEWFRAHRAQYERYYPPSR
jgi:nucleoside-diphosphate-sugar epimerase